MSSDITLYNSLGRELQVFTKKKDEPVLMYNCGPTVYDLQHIGNLSSFVFADTLRKTLEYNGYTVKQVINITDIGHLTGDNHGDPNEGDDKMMRGLKQNNLPISLLGLQTLASKYTAIFLEDLQKLGIETDAILFPKASDYIPEQVAMIALLEEKGHVYTTKDGVYFDTSTFKKYGELGGVSSMIHDKEHARIQVKEGKRHVEDFALWKYNTLYGWESTWGKGFPGWHIECSAMATALLGKQIDIHTGGIEHIQIHHNNEIAQSECANGCAPFSRFWVHRNHLQSNNSKMSKSEGTAIFLSDILMRGFSPYDFRYFCIQAQYSTASNFTWEALEGCAKARKKMIAFVRRSIAGGLPIEKYKELFTEAINADLNTPKALAVTWTMLDDQAFSKEERRATLLSFDTVFGLGLEESASSSKDEVLYSDEDKALIERRKIARESKDWKASDELRVELQERGYTVIDSEGESQYQK